MLSLGFNIVGVRDCEVQDHEYPTRFESQQKSKTRPIRNAYNHPNFISLYIDDLKAAHDYLKQQKIPLAGEGIVKGDNGADLLAIPPTDSLELFNLCDNPTFVELVQANADMIKEFKEIQEEQAAMKADTSNWADDIEESVIPKSTKGP